MLVSGVSFTIEIAKVRQSVHRQAVFVFFALDVDFFIKCLESRSQAPFVSERFAKAPYMLSARSTGKILIGLFSRMVRASE
jgi:hypothetical protein